MALSHLTATSPCGFAQLHTLEKQSWQATHFPGPFLFFSDRSFLFQYNLPTLKEYRFTKSPRMFVLAHFLLAEMQSANTDNLKEERVSCSWLQPTIAGPKAEMSQPKGVRRKAAKFMANENKKEECQSRSQD